MIKSSGNVLLDTTLMVFFAGVATVPFLPFVELPAPAVWPYIAASMAIHIGYYTALVGAYRAGDLSHGYPIMRGLAPLIVSLCALAWLGEAPTTMVWVGVLLICGGVLSLGFAGFRWQDSRVSLGWALANAVIIAAYTLVDAAGVRTAGRPESYVVWLFVLDALPFPILVLLLKRQQLVSYAARFWLRGLVGGGAVRGGVWRGALGDDARAGRRGRRAARDLGDLCRADRRLAPEGRPHRAAPRGRRNRRRRRHRIEDMKFETVIVGGGIVGASVAYHLAKLGRRDIVLLEQGRLTCGTTWHAAGLVGQMRPNRSMTRMSQYGIQLYSSLEQETGLATGWKQCGSVNVARTPERWIVFQRQAAMARSFGIEVDLLTPREALEKWPLLRIDDLQGALWFPADGKANPADLAHEPGEGCAQPGREDSRRGARLFHPHRKTDSSAAWKPATARSPAKSWSTAPASGRARSARRAASTSRCTRPSTSTSSPSRSRACIPCCR